MPQLSKNNRNQLQMLSISEHVPEDSLARVIDVFVDTADLSTLGFQVKGTSKEGRPAFAPETLTKLYLYGYLHGIRSSREPVFWNAATTLWITMDQYLRP